MTPERKEPNPDSIGTERSRLAAKEIVHEFFPDDLYAYEKDKLAAIIASHYRDLEDAAQGARWLLWYHEDTHQTRDGKAILAALDAVLLK